MPTTTNLPTFAGSGSVPYGNSTLPYGNTASAINQFMTNEAIKPFLANLPGYAEGVVQRGQNTNSMLKGDLPQDVVQQITQRAAERGIGGGVSGSANSNAALLRAMGLSSLDLMGQGSKELSQSIADTPTPEPWNPASLIVPQYTAQQELGQAQASQQNAQLQQRNAAASAAWNARRNNGTSYSNYFGLYS